MEYYHSKLFKGMDFEQAIQKVTEALKEEGFGVLSDIDVSQTLKKKLDVNFRPYRILGACNPQFAHQALTAEDKIGTMLPCNVIVQQQDGSIEVAVVDPVASMQAVENKKLAGIAEEVRDKLKRVLTKLD